MLQTVDMKPREAIMATAFKEKTRAEITYESTCDRCGGLMVADFCMDLLFCIGETKFAAKRCVQCGEIVDPVILRNRQLRQNSMAVQLAGKMLRHNCVAKSQ
jgi:hypothetical protein